MLFFFFFRKPDVELEMNVAQPPIPRTTVSTTSTSTTVRTKEEVPVEKPKTAQESKYLKVKDNKNYLYKSLR